MMRLPRLPLELGLLLASPAAACPDTAVCVEKCCPAHQALHRTSE